MIAYSYIRFSTPSQRLGHSRERQHKACVEWCQEHGITLSEDTFFDAGRSGYTGDHLGEKGQLRRFLDLVEEGRIEKGSYLVVESLDRLGRQNVWKALPLLTSLIAKGINVVTLVDGQVYSQDSDDRDLMLSIVAMGRAHNESEHKSVRAKKVWAKKLAVARETGAPVGRQVAKWLSLEDGRYVLRGDRAAVVRRIFALCIEGRGAVSVSQMLNAEGVPAFRHGGTWSTGSVLEILKNRRVLGEWEPADGRGKIENYFPYVIDIDTWNRAHLAMDLRRRTKTTKQTKNFQVWQGVARCMQCGKPMHLNVKGNYRYLACSHRRKGLCNANPIRADEGEMVFRELMAQVGAISLVHTDSASILRKLESTKAEIHQQELLLSQHIEAASQYSTSKSIYQLIEQTERKVNELRGKAAALEVELVQEEVNESDKEWFVQRLELDTYAGRSKANGFLRRLDVTVYASRGFYVVNQSNKPTLIISVTDDNFTCTPLSALQAKRMEDYGDRPFPNLLDGVNVRVCDAEVRKALGQLAESLGGVFEGIFNEYGSAEKTVD